MRAVLLEGFRGWGVFSGIASFALFPPATFCLWYLRWFFPVCLLHHAILHLFLYRELACIVPYFFHLYPPHTSAEKLQSSTSFLSTSQLDSV
ncbi:hypothetical protein L1887_31577 [Cichorium endivia]|nr:hypothetical protein L1887_31577 [Cichorium endivia]